jgi:hypothetical protein
MIAAFLPLVGTKVMLAIEAKGSWMEAQSNELPHPTPGGASSPGKTTTPAS